MKNFIIGIKYNKGFTLIELLVSMSVLLIVVAVATALFVSAVREQKIIMEKQQTVGQLSYALEYMSKALRMASKDAVGDISKAGGCLGVDRKNHNYLLTRYDNSKQNFLGIKFINSSDDDACTEFYVENSIIMKIRNNESPVALTSGNIKIKSFYFVINGSKDYILENSDTDSVGVQPRITIFLEAESLVYSELIKIQTTISQRNINTK